LSFGVWRPLEPRSWSAVDDYASFSAAAVAAAATERALGRLLRGASWSALSYELAWHAVAAAGGDQALIAALAQFADERLSEAIDGVEFHVDAATVRARSEHLRWRPHDHAGAELAAMLEANDEAERLVLAAYERARGETEAAGRSRVDRSTAQMRRRRLGQQRSEHGLLPPPDLGDFGRRRRRYGWPRRDAA
jgi:hypothetical protein